MTEGDKDQCFGALRGIIEQTEAAMFALATGKTDEVSEAANLIETYAREVQGVIRDAEEGEDAKKPEKEDAK